MGETSQQTDPHSLNSLLKHRLAWTLASLDGQRISHICGRRTRQRATQRLVTRLETRSDEKRWYCLKR